MFHACPDLSADFMERFGLSSVLEPRADSLFKGTENQTSFRFRPACKSDQHLQDQLRRYYYWQAAVLIFLIITYIRVLASGALVAQAKPLFESAFESGNPQIEFMNNKIKIRKEDPCRKRDLLFLKSWTGSLLGLISVMSCLFSLFKLLPAIYASSCH